MGICTAPFGDLFRQKQIGYSDPPILAPDAKRTGKMKIALLGDTALFGRFDLEQNPKAMNELGAVKDVLSAHDTIIANLETPFGIDFKPLSGKSAHLCSPELNVEILKYLGITHVSLANNHIGDFGGSGIENTIEVLEKNGIDWFGYNGKQSYYFEKQTRSKIALMGYCAHNTNPLMVGKTQNNRIHSLDIDVLLKDMRQNQNNGYLNILSLHSGQEHIPMPSQTDVKLARGLAANFNYIYYGHHPHVIQGMEEANGSPIFYSLGNFLFDDVYTAHSKTSPLVKLSKENKKGLIVSIEVIGQEIVSWKTIPTYIGDKSITVDNHGDASNFETKNAYLRNVETESYTVMREAVIQNFFASRKKVRDIKWYIKRLNFNSIMMLLRAKNNKKLQTQQVDQKLHKLFKA
jgi:poly-gamma-glutamate synthesis protein (capsule biosynthesis protein)